MPFRSKAQQRFMFAVHPGIAKRWADETPNIKSLPKKVKKKKLSEGVFSKLAESMTKFKVLTEVFQARVNPAVQRLRRFRQTRQHNFARKGLSAQGRDLRSALRKKIST